MFTRMTRRVLQVVDELNHGTGVTVLRIITALRLSRHYFQHNSLVNTLNRAVRDGYLRLNRESGRYFPRSLCRLRQIPREHQTLSVVNENEMPVIIVASSSLPSSSNRPNHRTAPRREIRQPEREVGNIVEPQRRQRFDQSVVINIARLPLSDFIQTNSADGNNNTEEVQIETSK